MNWAISSAYGCNIQQYFFNQEMVKNNMTEEMGYVQSFKNSQYR